MRSLFCLAAAVPLAFVSAQPVSARQVPSAFAPKPVVVTPRDDGIDILAGTMLTRITALNDHVLRVRVARDKVLPEDASWAVTPQIRAQHVRVMPDKAGFATAGLRVHVDGGRVVVTDVAGHIICADAVPISFDDRAFTLRKALSAAEHIFALGDKTGADLDRRGQTYVDWNTDVAFSSTRDPIYKSIPFFLSAGGTAGSYGLLLDNSYRATFDFGHADPERITLRAPDGPVDYYVIAGPTTAAVVRRYTALTGRAPLPPRWALGFQQSRFGYMTQGEVHDIASRLRGSRVPTDALWLDIDFQDRNRPFTVDRRAFPDLAGLARDLSGIGINLVAITDLHIAAAPNQGYSPYDRGVAGGHFVRNPDGTNFVGPVWPGPAVFPDFTQARTRDWWGGLYRAFVDDGIAGFWNDMNEPAVFNTPTKTMPLDTVHRIAGDGRATRTATHAEVHNVYGMQNTRATFDGLRTLRPDARPFVMTRATYAGGQRYAVTWTGDNSSTWDHLRLAVHQIINLGLSGFAWAGADVGGFTGGASPELMTRWFEIGAFTPIFRAHADKNAPRAEPWVDGPVHLAIRRRFVEERYRLMPYLYALADQNARTGDPIMRPVFYDYPTLLTARTCDQSMTFTVGAALLVAPPPKMESPGDYVICLPAGGWYDLWSGKKLLGRRSTDVRDGDAELVTATPRLDQLPVYVRAGTILPRQPLVQSLSETPVGPLELHVYPGATCTGTLYTDDGRSMAFTRGGFSRQQVSCRRQGRGLALHFGATEGNVRPWWTRIAVIVHGWSGEGHATLRGHALTTRTDADAATLRIDLPAPASASEIVITPR